MRSLFYVIGLVFYCVIRLNFIIILHHGNVTSHECWYLWLIISLGILLPYPQANLILDVVLLLLYLGLEALRLFYGQCKNNDGICCIVHKYFTCFVAILSLVVDWNAPFSGWKGNLCERSLMLIVSVGVLVPCTVLSVYYLLLQTFILRLEFIINAILLCFYALELVLALITIAVFSR